MTTARALLVGFAALLLAVQVVRNAAVAALVDRSPDIASRFWPTHPAALASLGMTEIGRSARQRKPVSAATFAMMNDAALKAPLAPEPFLVRGVKAQLARDPALALQAFTAAERRDPRALPAHYFLADALFRSGDSRRGLEEIAVLARLSPLGVGSIAPYLAAYARDRRTWPRLRQLFRADPELEITTLAALASDPHNADAVMALSDDKRRGPQQSWVSPLLYGLVGAGEYGRARAMWAQISHLPPAAVTTVYDGGFSDAAPPPPFNWQLMASSVGLAERQPGGKLHVIFYGREDGLLAKQLLVLPPGRYRMSASAAGNSGQESALTWSLRCDHGDAPFAAARLDVVAARPVVFTVPARCPAQWLELSGVSSDVAQQSEVTISRISIVPESPND